MSKKQHIKCEECVYNKCCQDAFTNKKSCLYKSTTLKYIAENSSINIEDCTDEIIQQYLQALQQKNYNYAKKQLRIYIALIALVVGATLIATFGLHINIFKVSIVLIIPILEQLINCFKTLIRKR